MTRVYRTAYCDRDLSPIVDCDVVGLSTEDKAPVMLMEKIDNGKQNGQNYILALLAGEIDESCIILTDLDPDSTVKDFYEKDTHKCIIHKTTFKIMKR